MADLLDLSRVDEDLNIALTKLRKERAETSDVLADVQLEQQDFARSTLAKTQKSTNITVTSATEQQEILANLQKDIDIKRDYDANPLRAAWDDIVGQTPFVGDQQTGPTAATKRIEQGVQQSGLLKQSTEQKQRIIEAEQRVATAKLKGKTGALSIEAQQSELARQEFAELLQIKQAGEKQKARVLETESEEQLKARVEKGELTEQEFIQAIGSRQSFSLSLQNLEISVQSGNKAATERNRQEVIRFMPDSVRKQMIKSAVDGVVTDPDNPELKFTVAELQAQGARKKEISDIVGKNILDGMNAEADAATAVIQIGNVLGMPGGVETDVAIEAMLADPNVSPGSKSALRKKQLADQIVKDMPEGIDKTAILQAANDVLQVERDRLLKQELDLVKGTKFSEGVTEYNTLGKVRSLDAAIPFVLQIAVGERSSGKSFMDTFFAEMRKEQDIDLAGSKLDAERLKNIDKSPHFKVETQLKVLANALPRTKNDDIQSKLKKAMFAQPNKQLLDRTVASIADPALSQIWQDAKTIQDLTRYLRSEEAQKAGTNLADFKVKLNEEIGGFSQETFIPEGQGRVHQSSFYRMFFDNDIIAVFRNQMMKNINADPDAALRDLESGNVTNRSIAERVFQQTGVRMTKGGTF